MAAALANVFLFLFGLLSALIGTAQLGYCFFTPYWEQMRPIDVLVGLIAEVLGLSLLWLVSILLGKWHARS